MKLKYSVEDNLKVLQAVTEIDDKIIPVSRVAKQAGLNTNKVRFMIADMVALELLIKEPVIVKESGAYKRYTYHVTEAGMKCISEGAIEC